MDDGPATASGTADQVPDERGAPGSGTRVEAGTNTAGKPTSQPLGTAPPWGRGHLDYARLEGDACHPSDHAEQAAAQDLGIEDLQAHHRVASLSGGQHRMATYFAVCHLGEGARTMADITFGHRTGHTPPATMDHPGQWQYVAARLMAHMGAYSPDYTGNDTSTHPCASVRPCKSTTSGTSLDPRATKGTCRTTGSRGPKTSRSPPGRRRAVTHQNANGGHNPEWVQKPPPTFRPAHGPRQSSHLRDARRHAG